MDFAGHPPGLLRLFEFARGRTAHLSAAEVRTKDGKQVLVLHLRGAASGEASALAQAVSAFRASEGIAGEFVVVGSAAEGASDGAAR